jgi:hypothetical protein
LIHPLTKALFDTTVEDVEFTAETYLHDAYGTISEKSFAKAGKGTT